MKTEGCLFPHQYKFFFCQKNSTLYSFEFSWLPIAKNLFNAVFSFAPFEFDRGTHTVHCCNMFFLDLMTIRPFPLFFTLSFLLNCWCKRGKSSLKALIRFGARQRLWSFSITMSLDPSFVLLLKCAEWNNVSSNYPNIHSFTATTTTKTLVFIRFMGSTICFKWGYNILLYIMFNFPIFTNMDI